jgi:MFS transporter, PHS family, inorganic phosphate transporter
MTTEGLGMSTASATELLERMDEAHVTRLHWKIMFISGMAVLTDAYDLFIIGVAVVLLKHEWQISILFLCSNGSSFITSSDLSVDGRIVAV